MINLPRGFYTCGLKHDSRLNLILWFARVEVDQVSVHQGNWYWWLRMKWIKIERGWWSKMWRLTIKWALFNLLGIYFHGKWIKVFHLSVWAVSWFIYRWFWAHEIKSKSQELLINLINIIFEIFDAFSFAYWRCESTYVVPTNFTFCFVIHNWWLFTRAATWCFLSFKCAQIYSSQCILICGVLLVLSEVSIRLLLYEAFYLLL